MNNIREYRKRKGYTQSDIAKRLGIKQGSYSDKENGKRGFSVEELLLLEVILDASIAQLFKPIRDRLNI